MQQDPGSGIRVDCENGIAARRQHPARERQHGRRDTRKRHAVDRRDRGRRDRPFPQADARLRQGKRAGVDRPAARGFALQRLNGNVGCVQAAASLSAGLAEWPHGEALGVLRFDPREAVRPDHLFRELHDRG